MKYDKLSVKFLEARLYHFNSYRQVINEGPQPLNTAIPNLFSTSTQLTTFFKDVPLNNPATLQPPLIEVEYELNRHG